MAVRPVVAIGDPVLRAVAERVEPGDIASPEVQSLIDDLIDTMRAVNGAGIAAPQIGVSQAVAVIEVTDNPRYPYKPPIPLTVIVNPTVRTDGDETIEINEGCLSVPLRGDLHRAARIEIEYRDREGRHQRETKEGLTAGTFQHEVDHLRGMLIVDRIDPRSLSTWEQFEVHHRAGFLERIAPYARSDDQ